MKKKKEVELPARQEDSVIDTPAMETIGEVILAFLTIGRSKDKPLSEMQFGVLFGEH